MSLTTCRIYDAGVERLLEHANLVEFRLLKCTKIGDPCLSYINRLDVLKFSSLHSKLAPTKNHERHKLGPNVLIGL